MADAEAQAISKSAKRRAAKKARDAAHVEEEVKPQAKAEPKPKAQPKAAEPAPKAKAKAKAEPKAEAKAKPAEPKSAPKAEAKKEPESKAAAKQAAAPAAKSAGAKSKAQPKAKAKAKQEEEEEQKPKKEEAGPPVIIDDGTGGDWEVSTGLSNKKQKQKERKKEEEQLKKQIHDSSGVGGKLIPGMAPPGATIPGMKPGDSRAAANAKAMAKVGADAAAIQSGIAGQNATTETAPKADAATATIQVPESKIGIVIGPKGSKIKMIQEKTGVTRIDTTGELFTVTGNKDAVAAAENAIKELIEKGFTSLSFEDFAENFVMVHPSSFPDLIGKGGCVVQALKKELQVEVNFPETPKNCPPSKKFKVTIAGAKANVEKAKEVIHNIQMYYHDEITHPDQVHEELDCAEWLWRFLIGKGGSEMRHIQNNYKVRVYIPRETSMNTKVVVVGEQPGVERAKTYIDKLLWNAEHAPRGRDRGEGGADDGWGDEDEEEEWMQQYMVKRR